MSLHKELENLAENVRMLAAIDLDQLNTWGSLYPEDVTILKLVKAAYAGWYEAGIDKTALMPPDGSDPDFFAT